MARYNVMIKGNLRTTVEATTLPHALAVIADAGLNPDDVTRLELSKPRVAKIEAEQEEAA